jgi:hypothetical protein
VSEAEVRPLAHWPGKCTYCEKRREVYAAQRKGGGNYRRAGRWYSTSLCGECAVYLLEFMTPGHQLVSRLGVSGVKAIAAAYLQEQSNKIQETSADA